ncbi:hypothetical protein P7C71_g1998, partial [Lecanoromycetidae sp. Uapishka_2]
MDSETTPVQNGSDSSQQTQTDEEKPASPQPEEDWFLFASSTLTSIFLYALDKSIVANIIPGRDAQPNWVAVPRMDSV